MARLRRSVPCALKGVYMSIDTDQAQKCIRFECVVCNEKTGRSGVLWKSLLSLRAEVNENGS